MTPEAKSVTQTVFYRTLNVEGLEIFYREAGPRDAPTVMLSHSFQGYPAFNPLQREEKSGCLRRLAGVLP